MSLFQNNNISFVIIIHLTGPEVYSVLTVACPAIVFEQANLHLSLSFFPILASL